MLKKTVAVYVALAVVFSPSISFAGGFVDDWLQQKTSTNASFYEGDTRGYFTGGSFSGRWQSGSEYPVSVSLPSVSFGCGGIDAYMGGLSFLTDPSYLQSKLESILSSASAVAFDMALAVLAEQASSSIKSLEAIANKLNNLQIDDCAMAKKLVGAAKTRGESMMTYLMGTSSTDNPDDAKNSAGGDGGSDTTGDDEKHAGCPSEFTDIFVNTSKTFLEALGDKKGWSSAYVDFMRGFVGDVKVDSETNSNDKLQYVPHEIQACDENDAMDVDNFITGNAYYRPSDESACQKATDTNLNLVSYTTGILQSYVDQAKAQSAQTASTTSFLDEIPMPITTALNTAIAAEQESMMIATLSDVVARAYAFALLNDLYDRVRILLGMARMIYQKTEVAYATDCQVDLIAPSIIMASEMIEKRLFDYMKILFNEYQRALGEFAPVLAMAERFENLKRKTHRGLTSVFTETGGAEGGFGQ